MYANRQPHIHTLAKDGGLVLPSRVHRNGQAARAPIERCPAVVISTLVELELLAGPLRVGDDEAVDRIRLVLDNIPQREAAPMVRTIARAAAEVRADLDLGTPDAILVATALAEAADGLISNDKRWAARIDQPRCVTLADFA